MPPPPSYTRVPYEICGTESIWLVDDHARDLIVMPQSFPELSPAIANVGPNPLILTLWVHVITKLSMSQKGQPVGERISVSIHFEKTKVELLRIGTQTIDIWLSKNRQRDKCLKRYYCGPASSNVI